MQPERVSLNWGRWAIGLLAVCVCLLLEWSQASWLPGRSLDRLITDRWIQMSATDRAESRIAVVDIDEASLAELGAWPWQRNTIAALLESLLSTYQVRGVGVDFVLPQTTHMAAEQQLAALAVHAPVAFSQVFDYVRRSPPLRIGALAGALPERNPRTLPIQATGYIANHSGLAKARCVGNIGLIPDEDGAIRRLPLLTAFGSTTYWPLAWSLARCAGMEPMPATTSRSGMWPVPYRRLWSSYTVVSAADVIAHRVPLDVMAGRLVLVGSSSFGLADRVSTPLDASTSGVMVHAAALSEILDRRENPGATERLDGRWLATWWIVVTVLLGGLGFHRLPALWSVGLLLLSSSAWLAMTYWHLPHEGDYSVTGPLLANFLLLLLAVPYEWRLAQVQSRKLIATFRHYVAKPVLDELLRDGGAAAMEPRLLEVTTLVADMQGYAGLVENASLQEAVALTRDFLDCITAPVLDNAGTLDKYTGDGLMAFWGAPLAMADHADRAVDAAISMVQAVQKFNAVRIARGQVPLRIRIGVDSGLAVAGDLGTPFRGAYTAVGDSVNVASRLQEVARSRTEDVIVGAGTSLAVRRHALRELGCVDIRGRQRALAIYTPEVLA